MSPSTRRTPVTDMTGKLRRRRRRAWRRRLLTALVVLLVGALVGGLTWLVGFSQVLASKSVRVTGAQTLRVEDVVVTAQVPMGVPLVRLDTEAIAGRVAALPQVARVEAHRRWPDTIKVEVIERAPVYVARTPGGLRLVDASGRAYLEVAEPPEGMVVAELGDGVAERILADLATVVAALTPQLRAGTITADSPDTITITLTDGREVVFGSAADAALKADVATKLVAAVAASAYDVSAPSRPVTR